MQGMCPKCRVPLDGVKVGSDRCDKHNIPLIRVDRASKYYSSGQDDNLATAYIVGSRGGKVATIKSSF